MWESLVAVLYERFSLKWSVWPKQDVSRSKVDYKYNPYSRSYLRIIAQFHSHNCFEPESKKIPRNWTNLKQLKSLSTVSIASSSWNILPLLKKRREINLQNQKPV